MRLLVVVLVLAAALAGWFLTRAPVVTAEVTPVRFGPGPLDAGFTASFTVKDVALGTADDVDEPVLHVAAMVRADGGVAVVDDASAFLAVEPGGGRVLALAEWQVEGPGPTLELLVSEDEGATYERRSIPKPTWLATFEGWRVDGDSLEVELSVDDDASLAEPWWRAYTKALVLAGADPPMCPMGRWVLSSRDGGRRWRLRGP